MMIRILLVALSLGFVSLADAGVRLPSGKLVTEGDSVNRLIAELGMPLQRVTSQRTCGQVVRMKKSYCSTRRWIWYEDDRYLMVQLHGAMIIKTGWTRFERSLKDTMR